MGSNLKAFDNITDETHKELHRGLVLAFKQLLDVPGISFDPNQWIKSDLIRSGDGVFLEFSIEVLGIQKKGTAILHMNSGYGSEYKDKTQELITETGLWIFANAIKQLKYKTLSFATSDTELEARSDHHPGKRDISQAMQAKTLGDLTNGMNELLVQLGVAKTDLVKVKGISQ